MCSLGVHSNEPINSQDNAELFATDIFSSGDIIYFQLYILWASYQAPMNSSNPRVTKMVLVNLVYKINPKVMNPGRRLVEMEGKDERDGKIRESV